MAETFQTEMIDHVRDSHLNPASKLMKDTTDLRDEEKGLKYSTANQAALLAEIHAYDPSCALCQAYEGNPDPPPEPEE